MTDEEVSNKLTEHDQRIKVCEHREADLEKVFAGEEAFDSHVRKEQNQKTRRKEI